MLRRFVQAAQAGTAFSASFEITDAVLPAYLRGGTVTIADPMIVLYPASPTIDLSINGIVASGWTPWDQAAGLPKADVSGAFPAGLIGTHTLEVTSWGGFVPSSDFDILLVVKLVG
ncbi:MAG: hypothetical protein IT378_07825 [Sandaracinaceae bacterium]|nr:hypothetical protein [Sandaracinaceae bacterium]